RHPPDPPPFPTRRSSDLLDQTDDDSRRQQVAVGDGHHRVLPAVAKLDADADAARTVGSDRSRLDDRGARDAEATVGRRVETAVEDRKSTRLNSSHVAISY